MASESALDATRRFVREHERGLIVAWIAFMAIVLSVGFVWGIVFRGAERVVDAFEARWPARVEHGAQLLAQGHSKEAADYLEALDAKFPAQSVKHRFDRERERLLTLLAQSYVSIDKKKKALATCERLVAFDPRNWRNHFTQAQTALAFSEGGVAKSALDDVLAIHPLHLPSVEARIKLAYDGSLYAEIPPLWRAYVEAFRLADVEFTFGGAHVALEVPSDGLPHRFAVPFAAAAGLHGPAQLSTHGWSIDIRDIAFCSALRVGVEGTPQFQSLAPAAWSVIEAKELAPGRIAATSVKSSLTREVDGPAEGVAQAAFEITAYKACSESLWIMVEQSYKNRLLWDELESMRARTRIGGSLEAGSLYED